MKNEKQSRKQNKIKAIIFDMNGVLALDVELKQGSKLSNSFHGRMAKSLNIPLDKWIDSIDRVYERAIEGKISEKETLNTIAKNLEMPAKKIEKTILKNYKKIFCKNKELYKYAYKLKKRGYKIAILSDQWHFSKKAIIDKRVLKNFNVVIVSSDVGVRKPEEKIYKMTLKKLKTKPQESIFIDNRDWNLKPAKKLGMKTILFKNNKQAIKEIEKLLK